MKTIVLLTPIPASIPRVSGGHLDLGDAARLSPASRSALVLALGFSDDVTALAAGPLADDALHEGLAYGATRAIMLTPATDDTRGAIDHVANARAYAAAIKRIAGDEQALVLGAAGSDTLSPAATDPTAAIVAGLLGWGYIGGVTDVSREGEVTARQGDTSLSISGAAGNLVLAVSDPAIAAHSFAWAGGIINAYRHAEVEQWGMDELLTARSPLTLIQLAAPPRREGAELLTDPPAETAAALVAMLRERSLI